jgi:Ser-tRNA(Ala) deacylase AlaX
MTRPAYERDAYLRELDTEVVELGVEADRPFAVTADTLFYPEGGGQPADRGNMAGVEIVDVHKTEDGAVRHYLSQAIAEGPVCQQLDWVRRYDHMQQHTAQHITTALALERFGWATTAFHLGPEICDIEFDVPSLERRDLDQLEDAVVEVIRAGRAVSVRYATRDQMAELGVRSRLLPQDFSDDELRRRRLAAHELRNARLREILDSADDDLPEIVQLRLDREKRLARDRRKLAEELAEAEAAALAAKVETVVARHWDDRDMDFLQKLGRCLVAAAPSKVALLTAGEGREGVFVVAAGEEASMDLSAVGPELAAMLEGRGGGARGIFQGKASKLTRRDRAAALLAERYGV